MKIISICNVKGGAGKTTTTVHLGAALAARGQRVLLIDMDQQRGLSAYFNADEDGTTTYDVLFGNADAGEIAREVRPDLFLVPATIAMAGAEIELSLSAGGDLRLRRALKNLSGWDFVLIDCPGAWGKVMCNALLASDYFMVPINSEPDALRCAINTCKEAAGLSEFYEQTPALLGILLSRYRRAKAALTIERAVLHQWGKAVFETRTRQAEKVNELTIRRAAATDVSSSSAGVVGEDHAALAGEVIARCKARTKVRSKSKA